MRIWIPISTLALAGLVAAPAAADWTAVSVSPRTGDYGYSYGFESRSAAEARAQSECLEAAGAAGNCRVSLATEACIGVVDEGSSKFYVAEGRTEKSAGARAMAACEKAGESSCKLVDAGCADE
jgi:hypothetical protein